MAGDALQPRTKHAWHVAQSRRALGAPHARTLRSCCSTSRWMCGRCCMRLPVMLLASSHQWPSGPSSSCCRQRGRREMQAHSVASAYARAHAAAGAAGPALHAFCSHLAAAPAPGKRSKRARNTAQPTGRAGAHLPLRVLSLGPRGRAPKAASADGGARTAHGLAQTGQRVHQLALRGTAAARHSGRGTWCGPRSACAWAGAWPGLPGPVDGWLKRHKQQPPPAATSPHPQRARHPHELCAHSSGQHTRGAWSRAAARTHLDVLQELRAHLRVAVREHEPVIHGQPPQPAGPSAAVLPQPLPARGRARKGHGGLFK